MCAQTEKKNNLAGDEITHAEPGRNWSCYMLKKIGKVVVAGWREGRESTHAHRVVQK